jgi:peptidase M28-like protein
LIRSLFRTIALLPVLFCGQGSGAEPNDISRFAAQLAPSQLMERTRELSSFEGRQAGTTGGSAVVTYLAKHLPGGRQSFPLTTVQVLSPLQAKIATDSQIRPLVNGKDFLPVLSGTSASFDSLPIIFVGYGITDPARHIDDYRGLSVTGKVALFLRGQPASYPGRVTHQDKVRTARAKGAAAYLTVTGPLLSSYERRRGISQRPMALSGETGTALPGLWIDPAVTDMLLAPANSSLESLQSQADSPSAHGPLETGSTLSLHMQQRRANVQGTNLWAFFRGSDPDLKDETVVLGAHYDHFGTQADVVFPGADDNASGTAVILELARILTAGGLRTKRSILLIAFSGEEQGMIGSRHYTSHPVMPLSRTRAMINVDHAGVGNGRITVGLSGIERSAADAAGEAVALRDRLDVVGYFPGGDHVPFVEGGVPTATIVSAGPHPDFHQPSDTSEKIQSEILTAVARYALSLLLTLANAPP